MKNFEKLTQDEKIVELLKIALKQGSVGILKLEIIELKEALSKSNDRWCFRCSKDEDDCTCEPIKREDMSPHERNICDRLSNPTIAEQICENNK